VADTPPSRTRRIALTKAPSKSGRAAFLVSCGLLVALTSIFTLSCAGLNVLGALAFAPHLAILSMFTAVTFSIPHFLVLMWLDRNDREPIHIVATAWLWGAVMATGLSLVVNEMFGAVSLAVVGDEAAAAQLTASLSAPFIEELTKAAALVVIYLFFRRDFDNVLDGVFYGAMVGLGFATFENFIYYANTGTVLDVLVLTLLRGVLTSIGSHTCFTAITGASVGLFRVMRRGPVRWLIPPAGLMLAMFVHFSWNTFTSLFMWQDQSDLSVLFVSIPLAVTVLQIPFVFMVATVSFVSLRHERWLITTYLKSEKPPVMLPGELERLSGTWRRNLHELGLLLTLQLGEWWLARSRRVRLVRLAFEKWHMDRELDGGEAHEGREHAMSVLSLRKELEALQPAAAPAPARS
jgi:RsiW-degrading membrane proteinase PrsW (M82 family)